jgi:uncharacterized protein YoxC
MRCRRTAVPAARTKEQALMTAGQLAALIAAVFFAVLACAATYVLLRIGKLLSSASGLLDGYQQRADTLLDQAQAAVDRTNEQLLRTDAITASMDEVTANVAELSGHVSAMTGLARNLSAAVGAPVTGISAVAYGVRRAVALRREPLGREPLGREPASQDSMERPATVTPVSVAANDPAALPAGRSRRVHR